MKRQKYKCKNIGEYKTFRTCTHPECDEIGFVSYRNDPISGTVKVEYRCIPHVHWVKEPTEPTVEAAKNPYTVMTDYRKYLYTPIQRAILER